MGKQWRGGQRQKRKKFSDEYRAETVRLLKKSGFGTSAHRRRNSGISVRTSDSGCQSERIFAARQPWSSRTLNTTSTSPRRARYGYGDSTTRIGKATGKI